MEVTLSRLTPFVGALSYVALISKSDRIFTKLSFTVCITKIGERGLELWPFSYFFRNSPRMNKCCSYHNDNGDTTTTTDAAAKHLQQWRHQCAPTQMNQEIRHPRTTFGAVVVNVNKRSVSADARTFTPNYLLGVDLFNSKRTVEC